ncbi:hypothetical protein CEP52_006672 [Fusarium oligoseptatum]|uniref:Uncharacterized protein n=1 Tax=Fusarium oligoseptatum TaxID=2604345 RepID=A0A428TRN1_9HYPO|nr:hypothetical protein CEP52_006672 [Fusarium oligoseptatum]
MSGAGYNDPDKLAAARELAMSFGNSSQPRGGGGGGGGGQRNGNNFGNRAPRERYNYSPPPPPHTVISNIPPPSRRNYTDTLVSGPVNRPPGQILGASSMDFLNRRDPTPQPTPANPTQAPPNQNTMAAIPSSMASNPVRNVVQKQNGTGVSGNENHTITPARANEGRIVDIKAESAKPLSTEGGQPNTNLPMSAAPAQAPARAPGSLQNNNIASTWAASYSDSSDEEEEEGEIIEGPKAGSSRKEDVSNFPKADEVEDLIMISPDHKHNSLYRGGISAPPMVPTETANGISVQKVRKNILPPVQENGRGLAQGSSAIEQASHEFATSRDQTRGENKPGPENSRAIMQPHLDTPQHHQTMPMQFPVMPITPGPTQPSQAGQNMTAAPVEKPKRKTQGLKSSMWAS